MAYQWIDSERRTVRRIADGAMIPADRENRDFAEADAIGIADPPPHQLSAGDYAAAVQGHVDEVARSLGYADGVAVASYVASNVPAWAQEAQAFVLWRDAVWMYSYQQLAAVTSGARSAPAVADFIAELPLVPWPS